MAEFDLKVHHRDKAGDIKKVTPYRLRITDGVVRFYRDGLEYCPDGSLASQSAQPAAQPVAVMGPVEAPMIAQPLPGFVPTDESNPLGVDVGGIGKIAPKKIVRKTAGAQ